MLNRRGLLKGAGLIGCSLAAHPLLSTVSFAAAPGENRLVVIILRGAMDGLDLVQPRGDALYRQYRPGLAAREVGAEGGPLDLDGFYALHPAMAPLLPLWQKGELGFVQATSTPYRDKRSHFDGQDILEAGTGAGVPATAARDGWLNRMLQQMPGLPSDTAFSVGVEGMLILSGSAPTASWAPQTRLVLSSQAERLFEQVYHDDPAFQAAAAEAIALSRQLEEEADAAAAAEADDDMAPEDMARNNMARKDIGGESMGGEMMAAPARPDKPKPGNPNLQLAQFAASRLRGETRIASFSIAGWDTHGQQLQILGQNLARLSEVILALRDGLGDVWGRTTVIAMTEFGRTARENGSGGTDHGTGGAMLVAGGAVKGGRVMGRWPGLDEADLYARRDLTPTTDVRAWAGWAMRGLYGFDRGLIEQVVFPGLDMGSDPGLLL